MDYTQFTEYSQKVLFDSKTWSMEHIPDTKLIMIASYDDKSITIFQIDEVGCHNSCKTCGVKLKDAKDCQTCHINQELQPDGSCSCPL